jgi:hypothetical protein
VVKLRRYEKSLAMLEDTIPHNELIRLPRRDLVALVKAPRANSHLAYR